MKAVWSFSKNSSDLVAGSFPKWHNQVQTVVFWDTLMFMLLQDGNGFINRMELRHVMMNLGEKMSEEECDALVDVRPHLSNFKVKLCRRKSKHNGGTFGSGKNRSNVTKIEKNQY